MKNFSFVSAAFVSAACGFAIHADVIEIQQSGFAFVPNEVTAAPGDTVRFLWASGTHTVTSGSECTAGDVNGFSFDEPFSSSNPTVEINIPADFKGDLGFFCDIQAHCEAFGMAGVIHVEGGSLPGDFDGNGDIDGGDLGGLLSAWGTDNPQYELSGDNVVNGGDLGIFLSLWTG